ncbi:MAG: GNAT family N-acetyltransferase [Woeseiaceae bacterium]|nr:GNAT family N-acetyltransferase [Woeseiaceae bacterium]
MIAPTKERAPRFALRDPYRRARKSDADAMAELVNFAGEGLPVYLWSSMCEDGQSVWDVGRERARRETGSFSYRNTIVRQDAGKVTAALIGYALPDHADPAVYDDMPAMFVPLQQLEDLALSTWYVNVLAAYPDSRGKGFGGDLLAIAESLAIQAGCVGLSIIVSDANEGARRLYERNGYEELARRPMIKEGWENPGSEWVLLTRSIRG